MTLFDPKANGNISPARAFIETTKQTYELGVQYVSAIQGGYYNAFVIKLPRIESGHAPYKLFVRESSQYSQKKQVYDDSFDEVPEIDLYARALYIYDRAANTIKQIAFSWNGSRTTKNEVKSITLPVEIQMKPDPSSKESDRQQLAKNICQKLQHDKQLMADYSQKFTEFVSKEVQ